jgi:hypothetical protein
MCRRTKDLRTIREDIPHTPTAPGSFRFNVEVKSTDAREFAVFPTAVAPTDVANASV